MTVKCDRRYRILIYDNKLTHRKLLELNEKTKLSIMLNVKVIQSQNEQQYLKNTFRTVIYLVEKGTLWITKKLWKLGD